MQFRSSFPQKKSKLKIYIHILHRIRFTAIDQSLMHDKRKIDGWDCALMGDQTASHVSFRTEHFRMSEDHQWGDKWTRNVLFWFVPWFVTVSWSPRWHLKFLHKPAWIPVSPSCLLSQFPGYEPAPLRPVSLCYTNKWRTNAMVCLLRGEKSKLKEHWVTFFVCKSLETVFNAKSQTEQNGMQ